MIVPDAHYLLKLDRLDGQGTAQSIESLEHYLLHALQPGGFMTALLMNASVLTVVRKGDFENRKRVHYYIDWLLNHAPHECWGSEEKVNAWLAKGPAFVKYSEEIKKQLTWEILSN
jgi:hypothetical protein